MIATRAIQRYKTVQVTTSSPGEVLVMLYEGLFRFLHDAGAALGSGDRAAAGASIGRAHEILTELASTLNPEPAPELCAKLEAVYLFCMGRLLEANLTQDRGRIDEVVRALTPLREAWITAVRGTTPSTVAGVPSTREGHR